MKKSIFITGATGTMGSYTVKELLKINNFKLKLLVKDDKASRKRLKKLGFHKTCDILYGDLRDEEIIKQGVKGADYVLHIGALVSPMADKDPKLCMAVNYDSTKYIIKAIEGSENQAKLVYIGSVAQTGDRPSPIQWGRVGDPIKTSVFDYYAHSKVQSERAVIESDIKNWLVLRQTGILPVNPAAVSDPITFHQNLNNVIEWVTAEESARLLANICQDQVAEIWGQVFNIGGGKDWRFSYYQLTEKLFAGLNVDLKELFKPKDFALYNFHGQCYADSDKLNDLMNFRYIKPDHYFKHLNRLQLFISKIPLVKGFLPGTKYFSRIFEKAKVKSRGPKWMLDHTDWLQAFYGSKEEKKAIKSWQEGYLLKSYDRRVTYLDHGYDESKDRLELDDLKKAAEFRGGKCLDSHFSGHLYDKVTWSCYKGHEFTASVYLVLKAGHWCETCENDKWEHATWAKHNPFFAQVWTPIHHDKHDLTISKALK